MTCDNFDLRFDHDVTNGDFTTLSYKLDNSNASLMWLDGNGVQLAEIYSYHTHIFSLDNITKSLIVIGVDEI